MNHHYSYGSMYDTYLEMIQVDDAENGIRIGFLPIHFDSGTHMIFLQKDIHNITQVDKLCVSGEELSKKSLQGVIVDLLGIEKVEIDVDNILYRQSKWESGQLVSLVVIKSWFL